MFDYSYVHWATFVGATILLTVSPGPDMAFILGHTVKGGRRSGFAAMFGVWSGAFVHAIMAALGLSAIVATSATTFAVIKWVGAAYLVWLGIVALRSNGGAFLSGTSDGTSGTLKIFRQGLFVSILNPKVAIFFLAFLPQFVVDGQGPVWAQLLLHGVLIIVIAGAIEPPLILLGEKLTAALRNSKRFALWLDRSLGAMLVALGLKLALSDR